MMPWSMEQKIFCVKTYYEKIADDQCSLQDNFALSKYLF